MFDEYCKECKYYAQAIDGKIVHEVCLMTKDKETDKCIFLALRNFGSALNEALIKTTSNFMAAGKALGKVVNKAVDDKGARFIVELNEHGKQHIDEIMSLDIVEKRILDEEE